MKKVSAALLVVVAALAQPGCSTRLGGFTDRSRTPAAAHRAQASDRALIAAYGQLPLSFEANKGQSDAGVDFQARSLGYAVFLRPTEAVVVVPTRIAGSSEYSRPVVVTMRLIGSSPSPTVSSMEPLPGTINYFRGSHPSQWTTNIPQYARVRYDAMRHTRIRQA